MVETLDATQWPRYMFHPEKDPERVETPEEEGELVDLNEGWRREPYSDLEKLELREEAKQALTEVVKEVQRQMEEPIQTPPRQSAAARKKERDKLSYARRKRAKGSL